MSGNLEKVREEKIKELQAQQAKLKELQAELENMNVKLQSNEKLSSEDTKFVGELGWLSAAAVSIAAIASSI